MKRMLSIVLSLLIIASLAGCNFGKPKFVQNLFSVDMELSEVKNVFSKSYNLEIKDLDYFRYYETSERERYTIPDFIQYRAADEDDYHFLLYYLDYEEQNGMIPLTPKVLPEYSNSDYTAISFTVDGTNFGATRNMDIYILLDSNGKMLRYLYLFFKQKVETFEYDNDYVTKINYDSANFADLSEFFDISTTLDLRHSLQYEYNDDFTLNKREDPDGTTLYDTINYTYDNNGYRETKFSKSKEVTKYYRDSDGLVIAIGSNETKYLPSGFVDPDSCRP